MKGYIRIDDNGEFYIIPKEKTEKFDSLLRAIDDMYNTGKQYWFDEFDRMFEDFKVKGDLYEVEIEIKEEI